MPSADFCVLTHRVSTKGAIDLPMSCCLFCVSLFRDSYLSTADGYAGYLVSRVNLFRQLLISLLSRDAQISPDKNVNFPCTNAAFELPLRVSSMQGNVYSCDALASLRYTRYPCPLPPNLWASLVLCLLAQGLSLICGFCPSARTFALRLRLKAPTVGFRPLLAETPLPSASTFVSIHYYEHLQVLVQGTFPPHGGSAEADTP